MSGHVIFENVSRELVVMTILRERNEIETLEYRLQVRQDLNREVLEYHHQREHRDFGFAEFIHNLIQNNINQIPEDFWEPVKVTASLEMFDFEEGEWECTICRQHRNKKTNLKCCKQILCDSCVENWFIKESVKCPYCKKDIREITQTPSAD